LALTLSGAKSRGDEVSVTIDGSAIFEDTTVLNYFDAGTRISITYVLMSADNTNTFSIHLPRVKVGSASTDDGESCYLVIQWHCSWIHRLNNWC
jgi:hypothetical protein